MKANCCFNHMQSSFNSAACSFDGFFTCNNNIVLEGTIIVIVSFLLCLVLVIKGLTIWYYLLFAYNTDN